MTELVNLKLSDLFFEEGFIKVTGKGNKQRFVPIGDTTKKYIQLYIDHIRVHQKTKSGHEDFFIPQQKWQPIVSRDDFRNN